MKKLNKLEKKVFAYLDRHVSSVANKQTALKILKSDFGFTSEEVVHLYSLWYYSQELDLDEFEYDGDDGVLLKFINTLITLDEEGIKQLTDDLYDSGMLDKILGPDFNANCGGWQSKTPCINFKKDGIQLELDRETWENYFSGLADDDLWIYHQSFNYDSQPEEVDGEEFSYVYTNNQTIEHLKTLSIMSGLNTWPGKNGKIKDGEVQSFLSKILPVDTYETIVDDYLMEFGIGLSRSREDAVRYCYEDQITYNVNTTRCDTGYYCIFISYKDLETMVVRDDLINLSDLKGHEVVNDDVYISDCWYDTWIDDEGVDGCIIDLNNSLDNTIEKIGEDVDLEELFRERSKMTNMLEKAGFVEYNRQFNGGFYKSKDGKIELHSNDINYKDKKIRFTYEGKNHMIPIEEFSNWIYGTPLDLNESVRVNKKLLKEQTEDIHKISIFDFDGTLMKTPDSKEGKKQWEKFYSKEYPHIGWWGKPESLDDAVFDIQPIESTVSDYKKEIGNPNTFVIMLTGRLPHQSQQIEELLAFHNIYFKEYHYKSNGDTLTSKLNTIKSLLNRFPQVKEIEMWEDREAHVIAFEEWGKENGINIIVNFVTDDINPITKTIVVENKLDSVYEKIKRPYFNNMNIMGLTNDEIRNFFIKKYGDDITLNYEKDIDNTVGSYEFEVWVKSDYRTSKGYDIVYSEEKQFYGDSIYWDDEDYKIGDDGFTIYKKRMASDGYYEYYHKDFSFTEKGNVKSPSKNSKLPKGDKFFDITEGINLNESTESVEDKLYNKIVEMIKPPYVDFLIKMGIDEKGMLEIFKKMYGDDTTIRFIKNYDDPLQGDYNFYVRSNGRNTVYSENYNSLSPFPIEWDMWDNTAEDNNKYRDSDDRKRIFSGGVLYDTNLNNWEEAPIEIRKDKFFTESEDKFHKYHTKLSNIVKPPYFKNLNYLGIDFKDWKPVLSMIFDRDIILDGVTQNRNDIIDSLTGEIIYSETDFGPDKGQTFANYITGEYGDTLTMDYDSLLDEGKEEQVKINKI